MSSQSEPIQIARDWMRKGHENDLRGWTPSKLGRKSVGYLGWTSGYLSWELRPKDSWVQEPLAVDAIGIPNSVCASHLN